MCYTYIFSTYRKKLLDFSVFFICRVVAPLVRSVDLLASGARPSYLYVFRSDATFVSSTNNKPRMFTLFSVVVFTETSLQRSL